MDPNSDTTYFWLWDSLRMQGNYSEAFGWFLKFEALQKTDDKIVRLFKRAYETSGWQGVMREQIRNEEKLMGFGELAYSSAQAGNKEKAFEYLEKAYQRHDWVVSYLQVAPDFDLLRDDSRLNAMVKRVGLK